MVVVSLVIGDAMGFSAILLVFLIAVLPLLVILPSSPPIDDARLSRKEPRSMNLFQKSAAGLNLTPWQRAALKLIEGLAVAFGIAALPVVADALSTHAAVDWTATIHNALLLGAAAVAMALLKYAKAQGDSPLLTAVEGVLSNVAASLTAEAGLNQPVQEPEPTPTPPTDSPASASSAPLAPAA